MIKHTTMERGGERKKTRKYEIKMTESYCLCTVGLDMGARNVWYLNQPIRSAFSRSHVLFACHFHPLFIVFIYSVVVLLLIFIHSKCDCNAPNDQSTIWSSHTDKTQRISLNGFFSAYQSPAKRKEKRRITYTLQNYTA